MQEDIICRLAILLKLTESVSKGIKDLQNTDS